VLTLPPPPPLSIAKLQETVAQLLALPPAIMSSAGKPPPPQLLLINGIVYSAPPLVASDMSAHETDAVDVSEGAPPTHVRTFIDLSSGAMRAPYGAATHEGMSAAELAESLTCLVRDLSPHDLATALLACRPLPPRRTPFTKGTLPEEKLEVLRSELFEHGTLPDDVFFDGRMYVSMDGDRSFDHPDLEIGITSLLAELNAEIDVANAAADAAAAKAAAEADEYLARVAAA